MACKQYNALSEMAAGGPAPQGLDTHVRDCARCGARLAELRQVLAVADQQMRELGTVEPSAAFLLQVRSAILEDAASPTGRMRWMWPSFAAAAVAGLAVVAVIANHSTHRDADTFQAQLPKPSVTAKASEPATDPVLAEAAPAPRELQPRHRKPGAAAAKPQVLIPEEDSAAFVALIALVSRDGAIPTGVKTAGEPLDRLTTLPAIDIGPIEIVPLDTASTPGT